jgi:hypothetical protein
MVTACVPAAQKTPSLLPFEDGMWESYCECAESEYGKGCYQAQRGYFEWMYGQNVHSGYHPEFSVAVANDSVVGYIHKMYLPWRVNGQQCRVPTIHNFLVKKSFRGGKDLLSIATAGGLLRTSLRGEFHAVLPSAFPPLADVYRRMNCQPIDMRWFRKVLQPVAGALRFALGRFVTFPAKGGLATGEVSRRMREGEVTEEPDSFQLSNLAEELLRQAGEDSVEWTPDLVKWRFFAPNGPRHVFVQFSDPREFAVLSLGPRQGIVLGRLIALSDAAIARGPARVNEICDVLRLLGAHAVTATTVRDDVSRVLSECHFSLYPDAMDTFLFHKDKSYVQRTVIGPEVTDLGFEAMTR